MKSYHFKMKANLMRKRLSKIRMIMWLIISTIILVAFTHVRPRSETEVTTIQGYVSNISTLAPMGRSGTFVTFSVNERNLYYEMVGSMTRTTIKQALMNEEENHNLIVVSVVDEPLWFNSLYLMGRERAVSIEGEDIQLPIDLFNQQERTTRIIMIVAASFIAILVYAGDVILLFTRIGNKTKQSKRINRRHSKTSS